MEHKYAFKVRQMQMGATVLPPMPVKLNFRGIRLNLQPLYLPCTIMQLDQICLLMLQITEKSKLNCLTIDREIYYLKLVPQIP